ncbi:MAG: class I SAM-dependent methyltransferase [Pseudomarimonas sp.]
MSIRTLFDDHADLYSHARPRYPATLYRWLKSVCPAQHRVWDAGCGNGQAAIDLRSYFDEVQATDISRSQIEKAPVCEGVTFSVQPAEKTSFPDHSFDAVCVAQALHWFDHARFWPEVMRVMKPAGVFCAWGYSWPHVDPAVDALLEQSFLSVVRPYWASQNQLLWDGYAEVPFPLERIEVPRIELSMDWSVDQFFSYLHSWSATRLCMQSSGARFFESSLREVRNIWGTDELRQVSMDFVVIAGVNRPGSDLHRRSDGL